MATKKYRSKALEAAHEAAEGLYRAGIIASRRCAASINRCLTAVERMSPKDIIAIRKRAGVSQGVFARYLNVPSALVSQWERGQRHPTRAAVKPSSIVKRKGLDAIA